MANYKVKNSETQINPRLVTLFLRLIQGIEMDVLARMIAEYEQLSVTQVSKDFNKNTPKLASRAKQYKKKK